MTGPLEGMRVVEVGVWVAGPAAGAILADWGADEAPTLAEYLGIDHRWFDSTMTGGSSFEFHVQHAAAAIRDGMCDTVLITYGSDFFSRMGRVLGTGGFIQRAQRVGGRTSSKRPTARR